MKFTLNKSDVQFQIGKLADLIEKTILAGGSSWSGNRRNGGTTKRMLLGQAAGAMRDQVGVLDTTKKTVESRFMEVGGGMESLSQTGGQLIKASEELIGLSGGSKAGAGAIQNAIDTVSPALTYLKKCQSETERLNGSLIAFGDQIEATLKVEQAFQRTVEPLRYIQTLFRVESASCNDAVRGMFLALVVEIENLQQQVNGKFREQFAKLRDTEAKLNRFTTSLNIALQEQKRVTGERSRDVEITLEKLQMDEVANQGIHLKLGQATHDISRQTAALVMALQYQDIISQKIEHIRQAIQEMAKSCDSVLKSEGDDGKAGELRFVQQAGAVASSQISHAITELENAQRKIGDGVRGMTSLLEGLDKECISSGNADENSIGAGEVVQRLLDVFEEVTNLMRQTVDSTKRAHHDIEPVGKMASNFKVVVMRLAHEMHLIGLNAQIQASVVGAGTGLEVLSSQTSAISTATTELSGKVSSELEMLQDGLVHVIQSFHRLHLEGTALFDAIQASRPEETRKLHQHRDACLGVLIKMGELLGNLHAQAGSLLVSSSFEEVSGGALSVLRQSVEEVSNRAGEWADELGASTQITEKTQEFLTRYTMASERHVHDEVMNRFAGNTDTQESHQPSNRASAGELDLFEPLPDQSITSVAAVIPETQSSTALDGVDLWLDETLPENAAGAEFCSQVTPDEADKLT